MPEAVPDILPPLVYEDESLLAFDKPSGLLVAPVRGFPELENLVDRVQERYGACCMNVHRIDRDTSGIVIFGRSAAACRGMQHALENRLADKCYVAIVRGHPPSDRGRIDAPLAEDTARIGRMRVAPGGKAAVTDYRLIAEADGAALLCLWPRTGRTHQLRVHLADLRCPALGDTFYGPQDRPAPLPVTRLALHALRMRFLHPLTGRPLTIGTALPHDLREAMACFAPGELLESLIEKEAGVD